MPSQKINMHKKSSDQVLHKSRNQPAIHPKIKNIVYFFLLLTITLITYKPALQGQKIWDDDMHITSPALRSIDGLAKIWFVPGATQQYYPLTHSIFWLEYRLWGDSTLGYHVLTIFLHVLSALLLCNIMRLLAIPLPWLIGAIFALHPVQVESVAWITELKNTLSGIFYLLTTYMYLTFDKNKNKKYYIVALAFFVLGLLSKSVIATLPLSLLAILWWKRGSISFKKDVFPLVPFFILGITSGLFTAWVEHSYIGAKGSDFNFTIIERCLIAGRTFWFYCAKSIMPVNLMFIYPRWNVSQAIWWQYLYPISGIALAIVFWHIRKKWRAPLASVVIYATTLFPVMGFFNVYPFRFSFVADHFQYLAIIIPIVIFVIGLSYVIRFVPEKSQWFAKMFLACILIPTLAVASSNQSKMYCDEETVYRTTISKNETCSMAHNNLGVICAATQREQEAANNYRKAIKYNKAYYEAYNNLGIILANMGRTDEAISFYKKALSINNNYAEGHYNLGSALTFNGHANEAIAHFQKALLLKPEYDEVHNNLGNALQQVNRIQEAIEQYTIVLNKTPKKEQTLNNLAVAYEKIGRIDDAIIHYEKALKINPLLTETLNSLSLLFEKKGAINDAIKNYQQALILAPDNIPLLYNYVAMLKRNKKFSEAIPLLKHALDLAKNGGQKEAVIDIEKELIFCEKASRL